VIIINENMKYTIEFNDAVFRPEAFYAERDDWCTKTFGNRGNSGRWATVNDGWAFKHEEDLVQFTLTWF
jgi:hypothetical protein